MISPEKMTTIQQKRGVEKLFSVSLLCLTMNERIMKSVKSVNGEDQELTAVLIIIILLLCNAR
jgi:hypothetical protein